MQTSQNYPLSSRFPALQWTNRFATLGEAFYTRLKPTPLSSAFWVSINQALASSLGLDGLVEASATHLNVFSGSPGNDFADGLASVYSGHQFGHWAGQLGDGRAIYLGEAQTPLGPYEFQLKGAGRTPYSRFGDGRAVLRSSIREYLCSEAMHALGVPSTRALCIVGSRDPVYREEEERAAVVTRLSPSFIRFGHFEHFAAKGDTERLKILADFTIKELGAILEDGAADVATPLQGSSAPLCVDPCTLNPYARMLLSVVRKTAVMIAHWQSVGFCHGVMNTDNMSILGLTLDYGPFQFLDAYVPSHICNHTDTAGRYAFDQQPSVAHWNLYCLGQSLLALIGDKELTIGILQTYVLEYERAKSSLMHAKLGLTSNNGLAMKSPESTANTEHHTSELLSRLERAMTLEGVDYTLFWRTLSHDVGRLEGQCNPSTEDPLGIQGGVNADPAFARTQALFTQPEALQAWISFKDGYTVQLARERKSPLEISKAMLRTNPKFVLRNHLAQLAIEGAQEGDFTVLENLFKILTSPFEEHPEFEAYAHKPPAWASTITISCSS